MKLRTLQIFAILVALMFVARDGSAVLVSGPKISNDVSGAGLLSFDLDLPDGSFTAAVVDLEGETDPLEFNAVVFNLSPEAFSTFDIVLGDGATFSVVGGATDGFDGVFPDITSTPTTARISFAPDEDATLADFEIGDPLGLTGAVNWGIDVSNVPAGMFSIGMQAMLVPEPATAWLLGLGLAALAQMGRRRAA